MANTINADNGVSSGSAGLKSSSDGTGILALQTNGTTAVTVDASQVVTLTNALPVASGGTGVTSSTGSGANVLGTSPTLTTPTINSAQVATVSGTAPLYMARAWIAWTDNNTATTTRGSGNVTSITRNATSDYTINFTTAMPDVNYSVVGNSGYNSTSMAALVVPINLTAPTTSAVRVQSVSSDGVLRAVTANVAFYSVAIFR